MQASSVVEFHHDERENQADDEVGSLHVVVGENQDGVGEIHLFDQ